MRRHTGTEATWAAAERPQPAALRRGLPADPRPALSGRVGRRGCGLLALPHCSGAAGLEAAEDPAVEGGDAGVGEQAEEKEGKKRRNKRSPRTSSFSTRGRAHGGCDGKRGSISTAQVRGESSNDLKRVRITRKTCPRILVHDRPDPGLPTPKRWKRLAPFDCSGAGERGGCAYAKDQVHSLRSGL